MTSLILRVGMTFSSTAWSLIDESLFPHSFFRHVIAMPYAHTFCSSRRAIPQYRPDSALGASDDVFIPVEQLRRNDAQVALLFLITNVGYRHPVSDPLFLAQGRAEFDGFTYYYTSEAVHVLGCVEQYELCNGIKCYGFASPHSSEATQLNRLDMNSRQMSTALRNLGGIKAGDMHEMIRIQQGLDLLANRYVYELTVDSLPTSGSRKSNTGSGP